jgi:glycosyltransferase involved in cell wall biosynthesis
VIQAWAHGLPVVAAASKGPASLIADGVDGRLTPIDDVDAFAGAVAELIASPELRRTFAAAGELRVRQDFSRAAVVEQWRRVLADPEGAACAA